MNEEESVASRLMSPHDMTSFHPWAIISLMQTSPNKEEPSDTFHAQYFGGCQNKRFLFFL